MTVLDDAREEHQIEAEQRVEAAVDHSASENPHLQHHFQTSTQQFEASKLGMWLFLATEVLFFGGLFCVYTVLRANHPEIFHYGSQLLDKSLGGLNTVVLLTSSLTMAMAVTLVRRGYRKLVALMLLLTFFGGATFMCVKLFEYNHKFRENLVWGEGFYRPPPVRHEKGGETPAVAAKKAVAHGDPMRGKKLFLGTCNSCHGDRGQGLPNQGKDLRGNKFVAGKTDREMVAFVKVGRMPFDPDNTTGVQMPPRGGNPMLSDADLLDIISFIRTLEAPAKGDVADGKAASVAEDSVDTETPETIALPSSTMPPSAAGPPGLAAVTEKSVTGTPVPHLPVLSDVNRPPNAHLFFTLYFCMTGLHAIHVLFGMGLLLWLAVLTLRGRFDSRYYTPIDLGGLYWHLVDLIWIYLFPMLYLVA